MSEVSPEFGHSEYPGWRMSAEVLAKIQDAETIEIRLGLIDEYEENLHETLEQMGF